VIIQSIRLKNIKSYGEGPNGNGITVEFKPGINRIAGKNGFGKTTLIESLGYALFLSKPQSEETFDLETCLVQSGKKSGEIDIVFSHNNETYRVERGLGSQNKRRSKVIQMSDGSTCAENDAEVAQFLARLLGFTNATRLPEVFAKLVGVKQGRLTWPFDSKPGDAKKYFEPLLDVAVFRDCFDRLKPAVDRFEKLITDQKNRLSTVEERIREREGSTEAVNQKQQLTQSLQVQKNALTASYDNEKKLLIQLEEQEKALKQNERLRDEAANAFNLATQQLQNTALHLNESQKASQILEKTADNFEKWRRADAALQECQIQQKRQRTLEREQADAVRQKTEVEGRAAATVKLLERLVSERDTKQKETAVLLQQLEPLQATLDATAVGFKVSQDEAFQATKNLSFLDHCITALPTQMGDLESTLQKIESLFLETSAWNPAQIETAQREAVLAEQQCQDTERRLAEIEERHRTLSKQLREISGGICPFLKEPCHQFKSANIGADAQQLAKQITELKKVAQTSRQTLVLTKNELQRLQRWDAGMAEKRKQLDELTHRFQTMIRLLLSESALNAIRELDSWMQIPKPPATPAIDLRLTENPNAIREVQNFISDFNSQTIDWWKTTQPLVDNAIAAFETKSKQRQAQVEQTEDWRRQLMRLKKEIDQISNEEHSQQQALENFKSNTAKISLKIEVLSKQLLEFASLPEKLAMAEQSRQANQSGYEQYLGAQPQASRLAAHLADFSNQQEKEMAATNLLKQREDSLSKSREMFDPESLRKSREHSEQLQLEMGKLEVQITTVTEELRREEKRLAEWTEACKQRKDILKEVNRLKAAIDLANLARQLLKNSAPVVAQHLCNRIALHAQQLFNQINHDPSSLTWDATRYSLRVDPGERRFPMLSGGEQTKLALAMTLAMIQEFSSLRFCIFDEPTYGVDAESRTRLASAILEAQHLAGLEQVLLVSHDDAFEGQIENVLTIKKTTSSGSFAEPN